MYMYVLLIILYIYVVWTLNSLHFDHDNKKKMKNLTVLNVWINVSEIYLFYDLNIIKLKMKLCT